MHQKQKPSRCHPHPRETDKSFIAFYPDAELADAVFQKMLYLNLLKSAREMSTFGFGFKGDYATGIC